MNRAAIEAAPAFRVYSVRILGALRRQMADLVADKACGKLGAVALLRFGAVAQTVRAITTIKTGSRMFAHGLHILRALVHRVALLTAAETQPIGDLICLRSGAFLSARTESGPRRNKAESMPCPALPTRNLRPDLPNSHVAIEGRLDKNRGLDDSATQACHSVWTTVNHSKTCCSGCSTRARTDSSFDTPCTPNQPALPAWVASKCDEQQKND